MSYFKSKCTGTINAPSYQKMRQPYRLEMLNVAKIRNISLTYTAKADFNQTLTLAIQKEKSPPAKASGGNYEAQVDFTV